MSARRRLAAFAAAAALLAPAALIAQPAAAPGLDLTAMDRSVAPGDDFYAYANGAWLKAAEIPPDRASWGAGAELVEKTDKRVADLIQEAAAKAPAGSQARKVGDYYQTYLDEARIDGLGLAPIRPTLARIGAIRTRPALAAELGRELRADVDAMNATHFHTTNLFGLWVEQDLNDPHRYAPYLLQGGLGLPDRDYYLVDNPHMAEVRAAYKAHLVRVLSLMGVKDAEAQAGRIYDLETRIARVHARARTPRTSRRRTIRGPAPRSRRRRPGSTGPPSSPPPGSSISRASSSGTRRR
jgi:putative endopeptidase